MQRQIQRKECLEKKHLPLLFVFTAEEIRCPQSRVQNHENVTLVHQ